MLMKDLSQIDYSKLDRPEILMFLFHPRPEWGDLQSGAAFEDMLIEVDKDVVIGARFHAAGEDKPTILFFHGNGEIVADYNEIGPFYTRMGINFLPADYRGYGRSSGRPTITAMMRDAHMIFDYVRSWLKEKGYRGPLIVMGRSLGSASALELAANFSDDIDGLIIESGFASARPLLMLLGVNMKAMGIREEDGFRNREKIAGFSKPALIIHGQHDQLLPLSEGKALYEASTAEDKRLLVINGATHNDIFLRGMEQYMEAVKELVMKL
jgi:alpha-beta hydrolase superfamily lysophospholipase